VLTADLVHARRRGSELQLVPLDAATRDRALAIAKDMIAIAGAHVGRTRDELDAALGEVDVGPREVRLKDALWKLIEDRCDFAAGGDGVTSELRHEVFARACALRAALPPAARFDRRSVLGEIARLRGTTEEAIEQGLFADLRGAQVLASFDAPSAEGLVASYGRAQAQAVLLRAVKVTVDLRCATAAGLRTLFHRLKFLRLLHTIEARDGGHRVVIDGPFSLFESVTKYGLQLALVLPALEACDGFRLEAEVRWGKERTPLVFRLTGGGAAAEVAPAAPPDEVQTLARTFAALGTDWRVSPSADILELPGIGLCVPDLVFERWRPGGVPDRVFLEVMGYWSRAAVWKRVELVAAGLASRVLFAVSSRLRVSEEVLDESLPGALYVYKQTMSARSVLERLERLARVPR
jgi:predicted nuclease of restriction endonuclease-like RecB superfamily